MQKRMLLSLFLFLNPFVVCAMEEDYPNSFFSLSYTLEDNVSSLFNVLRSYLPVWLVANQVPLSPMQEIQISKNKFEEELVPDESFTVTTFSNGHAIHFSPHGFFKDCYWLQLIEDDLDDTYIESFKGSLLDMYKKTQIDGYSALGAVIISKKGSLLHRQELIERLLNKGFTLTEKDKTLAPLALYNQIQDLYTEAMILLLQDHLHDHQKDSLAVLPHEVIRLIVGYMVYLHKAENLCYLLPWGTF